MLPDGAHSVVTIEGRCGRLDLGARGSRGGGGLAGNSLGSTYCRLPNAAAPELAGAPDDGGYGASSCQYAAVEPHGLTGGELCGLSAVARCDWPRPSLGVLAGVNFIRFSCPCGVPQ